MDMYVCMDICMCVCVYICICIYIYVYISRHCGIAGRGDRLWT